MSQLLPFQSPDCDALLRMLGSHWYAHYQGADLLQDMLCSRAYAELQQTQNLREAQACVSRFTIPVYHTANWYLLLLKESEKNASPASKLRYGDPAVYGVQPDTNLEYTFGGYIANHYTFPLPSGLIEAPVAFNKITAPESSYFDKQHYYIDLNLGGIVFLFDPFTDDSVLKRNVYENGELVDREAAIWLFDPQFDQNFVYSHLGYVLNLKLPSSQGYLDYANHLFSGLVRGTDRAIIELAVSALADVPFALEDGEVVQSVGNDNFNLVIVTNRAAYRFSSFATATVAVGDTLFAGQQLTDSVSYYEFNRGQIPDNLAALTLDEGFLAGKYKGGLTFLNDEVPIVVTTESGKTRIDFELGGWPEDVKQFFDTMHARGVSSGTTLANLLDQRTVKTGEPGAASLPALINPMKFLIQNVLRNNAFAIRIKTTHLGEEALGLTNLRQLRKLTPPHTNWLLLLELATDGDGLTLDEPGLEPGYTEDPGLVRAFQPASDTMDPADFITESPKLGYADGICLADD